MSDRNITELPCPKCQSGNPHKIRELKLVTYEFDGALYVPTEFDEPEDGEVLANQVTLICANCGHEWMVTP